MRKVIKYAEERNIEVIKNERKEDTYKLISGETVLEVNRHKSDTVFTIRGWQGHPDGYKLSVGKVGHGTTSRGIWYKTQNELLVAIENKLSK